MNKKAKKSKIKIVSKNLLLSVIIVLNTPGYIYSQSVAPPSQKIVTYVGLVHPIVTFSDKKPQYNFNGSYTGGFVTGLNFWKNSRVGFSLEFVSFVRVVDSSSKMTNFLFHPGALFALGRGYTLVTRAAFETSGRYGFTPLINKVVKRNANCSYYISLPVPVRFGNNQPASVAIAFQFGLFF